MISIQHEDFDLKHEYQLLRQNGGDAGAIVTFTGLVREIHTKANGESSAVKSLHLEHYSGMSEKSIEAIVDEAKARWLLLAVRVIHRVGKLAPGDQIVLVGISSAHRRDAFDAAEFIMDYLKSKAPFWKKQFTGKDSQWIESRECDDEAIARW
tara:strand:- start:156 stop:614 length:459 start_codon:yes stop_codon:yes gene_type:complete